MQAIIQAVVQTLILLYITITTTTASPLNPPQIDPSLVARDSGPLTNPGTTSSTTYTWTLDGDCSFELKYGEANPEATDSIAPNIGNDKNFYYPYQASLQIFDVKGVVIVPDINSHEWHIQGDRNPASWTTSGVLANPITIIPANIKNSAKGDPKDFNLTDAGTSIDWTIGGLTFSSPLGVECLDDYGTKGPDTAGTSNSLEVSCCSHMHDLFLREFTVKGKWHCTGRGTAG